MVLLYSFHYIISAGNRQGDNRRGGSGRRDYGENNSMLCEIHLDNVVMVMELHFT